MFRQNAIVISQSKIVSKIYRKFEPTQEIT